jgi:hypothetical protein
MDNNAELARRTFMSAPIPDQNRLDSSSGWYKLTNTDPKQTFHIINRQLVGIALLPGETKEIELVNSEAERLNELGKSNRLNRAGQVCTAHPVKVLGMSRPNEEKEPERKEPEKENKEPVRTQQPNNNQQHRRQ